MKIVIEPSIFGEFLKQVLMYESSPLLEQITVEAKPEGIIAKDNSLGAIGLYNLYTKNFFIEYQQEQPEKIVFTPSLLKALSYFSDEEIQILTDEEKIYLKGKRDEYEENLREPEETAFDIQMQTSEYGIIPQKTPDTIRVLISADELKKLPSSETYLLMFSSKGFKIRSENEGRYTKTIQIRRQVNLNDLEVILDGNFFNHIISNLSGEVWLHGNERAVVFSQKGKNKNITYLLGAREE